MKNFAILASGAVLGASVLAGCGLGGSAAKTSAPTVSQHTGAPSPSVSGSGYSSSAIPSGSTTGSAPSSAAAGSPAPVASSSPPASTSTTTTPQSSTPTPQPTQPPTDRSVIQEALRLAISGKVTGIPFVAGHSTMDQATSAWGQPQSQSEAGAGIYDTFPAHDAALGMNKGMQIFDVRSSSPTFQAITMSQVKSVLGSPGSVRHLSGQTIYLYPAGADYQLLWVFPAASAANPDPHVNHISVYDPGATVNIMAATQPAPSIVVDQAPGTHGNQFSFAIHQPPHGFVLAELVWTGSNGQSVEDTLNQAQQHGTYVGQPPYFAASGGSSTAFTFNYPSSMKNQSGTVKAIYQETSGEAMVGQSSAITLK